MMVIRVLIYEGDPEWIEKTFLRGAVKNTRVFDEDRGRGRVVELLRTEIGDPAQGRIISDNLATAAGERTPHS